MMTAPTWWYWFTGIAAFFVMVAALVFIAFLFMAYKLALDSKSSVDDLSERIKALTSKIESLVEEVRGISQRFGGEATGAATQVGLLARTVSGKVEPLAAVFGVIGAITSFIGARRRARQARGR